MDSDVVKTIAGYLALAVPATVALANLAKLLMEWLKQRHAIAESRTQQSHQITTHYLDRALDPNVPLAIRHQLLRFLATPDRAGSRLSTWAESELKRVGGLVEETNRAVAAAESEIQKAKSAGELAAAERKLAEAVWKQRGLLEPPTAPPVTAAAIRAGLISEKKLVGLNMKGQDLSNADFVYRELRGADFSQANLTEASLQGCDLRAANFAGAILKGTAFYLADLRGADFTDAQLEKTSFHQARLESANLGSAKIGSVDLRATYDESTQWPKGFLPDAHGAVHLSPAEPEAAKRADT